MAETPELGDDPSAEDHLELVFEAEFVSEDVDEILRIEDDGVVAYAYCWKDNQISGLVWLYNHGSAPTEPRERGLPQPNFAGFAVETPFEPIKSDEDVNVEWDYKEKRFLISIRGKLHAVLADGAFPGWCVLAENPSSLARQLVVN